MSNSIMAWRNGNGQRYTGAQDAAEVKRQAFLEALRTMTLEQAMKHAKVNKAAIGNWRNRHMAFKSAMDEILKGAA